MTDSEVHAQARAVLEFWFGLNAEQHFAKDAALDRDIATRFGDFVDTLIATDAAHCWNQLDTLLGAVVAIDQFSRNIHRGTAAAFAGDDVAQWLALHAIGKGWDDQYPAERRAFIYLPLMHAEDRGLQLLGAGKYERLGIENNIRFAREHFEVIMRFGRFPSRNAALGRSSTPEERDYLSQPGAGW